MSFSSSRGLNRAGVGWVEQSGVRADHTDYSKLGPTNPELTPA